MLVPADLADFIRTSMGFPTPVSIELTGWATGVIGEITSNARVNNASGTITGSCPPGGSLSGGAGVDGLISSMSSSDMASRVVAAATYPFISARLQTYCDQIVSHIQTFGIVTFASGDITGSCTNTPLSPGSLAGGAGMNGMISGLDGTVLANAIHSAVGYPGTTSVRLTEFSTAIVTYIMNNAQVSYASGNVTGTCPAGGGSLSGGTGVNGTIA